MIDFSHLFIATEKTGGLFDLDGTLPFVAFQIIILMFFLNTALYTPLLGILEERLKYIETRVSRASQVLTQANYLFLDYENKLSSAKKRSQNEISLKQKFYKDLFESRIKYSQLCIDKQIEGQVTNYQVQCNKAVVFLMRSGLEELVYQIVKKIYAIRPENIKILNKLLENPEILQKNKLDDENCRVTMERAVDQYQPQLKNKIAREFVDWWPNEENK